MASKNETIRAKHENLDRIVGDFENDLTKYLTNMKAYVDEINVLFSQLSANWSGVPYDNFKDKMRGPRAGIEGALLKGDDASRQLKIIRDFLAKGVEKMRQGGSK